jgi:uncharacterized protein YggE
MSYKRLFSLLVFISLFFSTIIQATESTTPHITVIGQAYVEVQPNIIQWRITIKNVDKQLETAATQHADIVANTLTLLKKFKIKKQSIQTTQMRFAENRKYIDGTSVKQGYFASTNLAFELKKVDQYQALWTALSKINAISINQVNYQHSQQAELQDSTRISALLNAKNKASALAKAIDANIAEALMIEEVSANNFGQPYSEMKLRSADVSSGSNNIALGMIKIEMKIKAVFRLTNE